VSRKGTKTRPGRAKPPAASEPDAATVSMLPMEIQIGDRFTEREFEWEVVTRPAILLPAHGRRPAPSWRRSSATWGTRTWPPR
jgi:hypothetical protein